MNSKIDDTIESLEIELPKQDSSFLYFILESNEGVCFYSTLDHQEGDKNRKVHIQLHKSLKEDFDSILAHLKKSIENMTITKLILQN